MCAYAYRKLIHCHAMPCFSITWTCLKIGYPQSAKVPQLLVISLLGSDCDIFCGYSTKHNKTVSVPWGLWCIHISDCGILDVRPIFGAQPSTQGCPSHGRRQRLPETQARSTCGETAGWMGISHHVIPVLNGWVWKSGNVSRTHQYSLDLQATSPGLLKIVSQTNSGSPWLVRSAR